MDAPPRLLVAGNWKMHGTRALARALATAAAEAARAAPAVEVAVFPPAPLLPEVAAALEAAGATALVATGGQQCHWDAEGAHTSSVAASMLVEAGCRYVLTGHSEVRRELGYDDARVRAAADVARAAGLRPVVCVGETDAERRGGRARSVLEAQVDAAFGSRSAPLEAEVAYEPVWAIGTGVTPTPGEAAEAHGWIRARLAGHGARSRILYGGSVAPANIEGFLSQPGVDGVLVGGASLKAAAFTALVQAARAAADRRRP